jgi:hypothetical protein
VAVQVLVLTNESAVEAMRVLNGRKSACEGCKSGLILLILLRSRKVLSFEARVLVKAVRVLIQTMNVMSRLRGLLKAVRVLVKAKLC